MRRTPSVPRSSREAHHAPIPAAATAATSASGFNCRAHRNTCRCVRVPVPSAARTARALSQIATACVEIAASDWSLVERYQFGSRTADYLLCRRCGVYVGAVCETGSGLRAVVNVNCLSDRAAFTQTPAAPDYDGEATDARLDRRATNWMPAHRQRASASRANRQHDAPAGADAAAQRTGHFGTATRSAAIRHRQFQDPQPCPRRLHLHLDIPAIGRLAHVEARQRLATDRAEGAHVGVANAIQHRHQPARKPTLPAPDASSSNPAHARHAHATR